MCIYEYCIHNNCFVYAYDFILLQGHLGPSGEAGVTAVRHVREVPHYAGDSARMEMTACTGSNVEVQYCNSNIPCDGSMLMNVLYIV